MDLIFNPEKFFYGLVQIFAKAIDLIVSVCQQICGIPDKDGKSILVDLISPDANGGAIYITFAVMISITIIFSMLIAMAESFRFKQEYGITPFKPYINVLKSATYMIVISFCFPIVIMIIGQLGQVVQNSVGSGNGQSIGSTILMNCFDSSKLSGGELTDWHNAWSNGIPSWQALAEASKNTVQTFNVWQSIISVGVMISPLIGIFMYMGKRLINILMLYVVSPIAFAMLPRDEGYAKDEWFKDMKSALLGGIVIMVIFTLFINISPMLYTVELVKGDNLMNSLFQSALVGAGAMCVLSVGKAVLKFMGCDDTMFAIQSASPMRALGAIKRGAGSIYRGAKSLRSEGGNKGGSNKSGESLGDGGSMDMAARFKRIEENRNRTIQGNIALKKASLTGSRSSYSGNVPRRRGLTSNADMPSYKAVKASKVGFTKTQTIRKPITATSNITPKNTAPVSAKPINSKTINNGNVAKPNKASMYPKETKPKEIKAKNLKDNENTKLTKAFDKFIKKFTATLKPLTTAIKVGGKQNTKTKIELKKPVKAAARTPIKLKPISDINGKKEQIPRIRINNAVRSTNIINSNSKGNQTSAVDPNLRQKLLSNERLLKENLNKLKKVNLNIQAVPRQVDKMVRKRK